MSSIVLVKGSLTLTLARHYLKAEIPRTDPRPQLTRGTYGTPGTDGKIFYPSIWEINWAATPEERLILEKILVLADSNRSAIRLYDYIKPRIDAGDRQRAIAPDSTAQTADGVVIYSAQFDVYPVGDLGISKAGTHLDLQFVLEELWPVLPEEDPT